MDIFPISPASAKPLWLLAAICLLLAVIFFALAYTAYASRHSRVEVHGDRIRLKGDFWGRNIPLNAVRISELRILDLRKERQFAPKRRTLGTGLPGYASGWFRLYSGEKALVYLTRRDRVVYLPTSMGYALLLSMEDPERFAETLRKHFQPGRGHAIP